MSLEVKDVSPSGSTCFHAFQAERRIKRLFRRRRGRLPDLIVNFNVSYTTIKYELDISSDLKKSLEILVRIYIMKT